MIVIASKVEAGSDLTFLGAKKKNLQYNIFMKCKFALILLVCIRYVVDIESNGLLLYEGLYV